MLPAYLVDALRPLAGARVALIALGFGLVHGLGFSSVLAELGLPAQGRVLRLAALPLGLMRREVRPGLLRLER